MQTLFNGLTATITGTELYSARCAMLHTYGTDSKITRRGDARQIVYMNEAIPEVRYNPAVATNMVMVSIPALRDALFTAIDQYLVDVFSDNSRAPLAEQRLDLLVHVIRNDPQADVSIR